MVIEMQKEDPYYNKQIACSVHNCHFNDCDNEECTLSKIKICNMNETDKKQATMCDSFEKRCD